nr:ProsJ [Phaeosphaeria sp.]
MAVSLAVFGPQSRAPSVPYLDSIRTFILEHPVLRCIIRDAHKLNDVRLLLSETNANVANLKNGQRFTDVLVQWLVDGLSEPAASFASGVVALPRLAIIQFTQYFQFLKNQGLSHTDLVAQVHNRGGLQGYCGGLPAAVALSCARTEQELVESICIAIRLAFAIGLYAELGDDSEIPGVTTAVIRLKHPGQAEELVRIFPHTYISAITDPKSVSVVGPIKHLGELIAYATQQGLLVQGMGIRGKTHNPENRDLAVELSALCETSDLLRLPAPQSLRTNVRSNRTGRIIADGSLTSEIVETVLASRCEWYDLLCNIASDLKETDDIHHRIVSFGIGDCVPLLPFNKLGLQMTKTDWSGQSKDMTRQLNPDRHDSYSYPGNAVAVIGTSLRLPGARNMQELWDLISKAEDRHEEVKQDRFDIHGTFRASQSGSFTKNRKFYGNFIDSIDTFDNAFFGINAREMLNMDPQQRMLLELAYEAMECSGYTHSHIRSRGDTVGCFIGASFVEYLDNTNAYPPTAYTSTGTIRAFLCGRLSYHFGWSGPAEVIDTACSSSLVAVNRAVKSIQSGECSLALTGGINLITGANNFLDLAKAGFLSPTGQCKPFDKSADGYCRAEGAGLVVLKPLKQAQLDGDHIMGVIVGSATNQGGLSSSLTVPSSDAQTKLYQSVLGQAEMSPDQVTYVEAHGTGTQAGDPLEVSSLRSVFGSPSRTTEMHIGSIKGNIGHCETAAGVAGLLKSICMLEHRAIPPQASHKVWNPKIPSLAKDRMAISTKLSNWVAPIRAALVNSYGAAGSNAAVICCEAPQATRSAVHTPTKLPVILSAQTVASLHKYKTILVDHLVKRMPQPLLLDIAATLNERRQRHKFYEVFEASSTTDLIQQLTTNDSRKLPSQAGSGFPVVLAFSGQSKQTVGLDRRFYDHFDSFRNTLDECDTILQDLGYPPILPSIFEDTNITDIVVLQAGFVAVQYAASVSWLRAGLEVAAIIGHSLGELTALAVSGKLSIRDCLRLVAGRADLMKSMWGPEKGSMLAVFSDRQTVAEAITGSELETACYNSETSQIITGACEAISKLEHDLASRAPPIKCLKVDTSHGFHSHLVDPILDDLDHITATLDWKEPTIPLMLCTASVTASADPYSPSKHARNPVYFVDAIRRLEQTLGKFTFLEAGMNTPITAMAKRAVAQAEIHNFVSLSTKGTENPLDVIARAVCDLWTSSIKVSHWSLISYSNHYSWLPPYQFENSSAWLDNIDRVSILQSQLDERIEPATSQVKSHPEILQMVTLLPESNDSSNTSHCFRVSVEGVRFRGIIAGHAVRSRPLCPASVYLECVTVALSLINSEIHGSHMDFQGLDIQAPLGVAADVVHVVLEETMAPSRWAFKVISRDRKESLHARGHVSLSPDSKLETIARLVSKRVKSLPHDANVERMLSRRAYSFFSRVVTYARFLEGIANIAMSDTEALADIVTPTGQPGLEESPVTKICDAVTMDNFIQVVGLLMNTSDMIGKNEVMVCSGIDSSMIAKGVNMGEGRSWKVHASYTSSSPSQALGDVLVFAEDGSVAAAFTGCRFSKLDMSRLERLLDSANQVAGDREAQVRSQQQPITQPGMTQVNHNASISTAQQGASIVEKQPQFPSPNQNNLRQILETYTGVAAARISSDAVLGDLGLDSLAATEMAGELQSSSQISLEGQDLLCMSVKELEETIHGVTTRGSVPPVFSGDNASKVDEMTFKAPNRTADQGSKLHQAVAAKLSELLIEMTGVTPSAIKPDVTLDSLGVDSLAMTEISSALSELCQQSSDNEDVTTQSTVEEVLHAFVPMGKIDSSDSSNDSSDFESSTRDASRLVSSSATSIALSNEDSVSLDTKVQDSRARLITDPVRGLMRSDADFETAASKRGFQNYWSEVAVKQDALTLAYILEAFSKLGVKFSSVSEGEIVPQPNYLAKHQRVFRRFQEILAKHGIIELGAEGSMTRGEKAATITSSSQLHEDFVETYPRYAIEAQLMALTGPKLADCLIGATDPIRLLFGSPTASKILEEYYGSSPMLSAMTSQLVSMITGSLHQSELSASLRILEIGAGTGGTTAALVTSLANLDINVQYTFTDVSSTMVAKARNRFSEYNWMSFERLDLEQTMPIHLQGKFDIVIGTNCVHATRDKVATTSRLRTVLNEHGFMVLSEVTRILDWYDIVFGLLEGWWLADGGLSYPLQPPESWMKAFKSAGFASTLYSQCGSEDANTQHLLVGTKQTIGNHHTSGHVNKPLDSMTSPAEKITAVYKEVEGVQIEADIYYPSSIPSQPMPIALMLHGGGHMTLSKRAIRPAQTAHLLSNGILPISLDYRLCPEINVIDGAMTDVKDAFVWVRQQLPSIVASRGITLDTEQIVVIGWSTGGHLAMSSAWTVEEAGGTRPKAILCFYAPVDFLSRDVFPCRGTAQIPHRMSRDEIMKIDVSDSPITHYDMQGVEDAELGWVKSGDARSELLLSLFREPRIYGLSLMLNGTPHTYNTLQDLLANEPTPERQAAMCPTARLQAGKYKVPTYIIHGENDEIALFESAFQFHENLKRQGVETGFLAVRNGSHIHDLRLRPGMARWDEQVAPGYKFLFDHL